MENRTTRGRELSLQHSPTNSRGSAATSDPWTRMRERLPLPLTERLRELAQQQNVTLFVVVLSALAAVIGRRGSLEEVDVCIRSGNGRLQEMGPFDRSCNSGLVVSIRLQWGASVGQLLRETKSSIAEAYANQARESVPERDASKTDSCSDVAFRLLLGGDKDGGTSTFNVLQLSTEVPASTGAGAAMTQLNVLLALDSETLTIELACASVPSEDNEEARVVASMQVFLEGIVSDTRRSISRVAVLTLSERERVLDRFNDTAGSESHNRLLHEIFEEQALRTPTSIALKCENQSLTYAELNSRGNQLARYLRAKGVGPDRLVGLYLERSPDLVIGILAILKAGGAYVPLDPSYPSDRLTYIVRDSALRLVLINERLRQQSSLSAQEVIALDSVWNKVAAMDDANLDLRSQGLTPQHLAYVIYTSGSTGEPKGVAAMHRGMVNRIAAQPAIYRFSADDICCQKTSIGFVDAIFEILGPLSYGRPLVLAPDAEVRDAERLVSFIEREHITRLVTVPSLAQAILRVSRAVQRLRSLRSWTLSGEELQARLLEELEKQLPTCIFVNLYGSSEVAADATYYVSKAPSTNRLVPIGRPIANTQIYILDGYLQPVPIGVPGEIFIGGVCLARGYLNRPALTADRFIASPFQQSPYARLYKSGDVGRWRTDGSIEYLGRNDSQLKIRGFRIEMGEIEAQLLRHGQVRQAAVLAREDVPGQKRLVAYITQYGSIGLTVEELRASLKGALPEYMLPSAFVFLDSLPLTPSGKVDRRALPTPQLDAYMTRPYESPQGQVEQILAESWQSLLGVERVGRQDNFFELGGHSLLIMEMLEQLNKVGLWTEGSRVFENATLAELASDLTSRAAEQFEVAPNLIPLNCEAINPQMLPLVQLDSQSIDRIIQSVPGGAGNIQDIYPLTPLQEGLLFHHVLDDQGGDTYVEVTLLSVNSRSRLQALIEALQRTIDRHDILRTAILWEQLPRPVQVVYREARLPVERIILHDGCAQSERIKDWIKPERQRLNLRRAPLIALQIAEDGVNGQWFALLQIHHMIDDDVSLRILIREVVAHLGGEGEELPEPVPYRNHVARALAKSRTHDVEEFFRRKLEDISEPTAPFGLLNVHCDGSGIVEASGRLDSHLARRVRLQAQRLGVSVATLFHAAWGLVVAKTSGRDDVVFGSVLLGRLQGSPNAGQVVGMFVNMLPLRLRLAGVKTPELVEQTRRELTELLSNEQASLVVAQRCSALGGASPLFSAVLNFRHRVADPKSEWASASGLRVIAQQYRTNYPISLSIDDLEEGFTLTAQTAQRIEPHRIIKYIQTGLQSMLDALDQAPHTPALSLSILPKDERESVTELFNATQASYPEGKLIHELFEDQAERTPSAVAVAYRDESLTYEDLNSRANQLAWYLRDKGVNADQLVGICAERSIEIVVGLLGILKAGGAYVPLDPSYPVDRLAGILSDASPRVLLIQERLRAKVAQTTAQIIALDNDWSEIDRSSKSNLDGRKLGLRSEHLAYVIYTSGSTGQPKGVMIEHRNVASLWKSLEHVYSASAPCQRIGINASFNFDASVKQLIQMLSGRAIVLIPQECRWDASMLIDYMNDHNVDGIDCTPSQLRSWISAGLLESGRCQLRLVLVGGEAIDAELWKSLARCSGMDFYNLYGPTESTVDATFEPIKSDSATPHIGRPMENRRVYILDAWGEPLPIGVAGEMYIGGAGVARGYLNRAALTAERFVANAFSADSSARLYKTGDLGRWQEDGAIDYIGRGDQQVKIRGFRIELGEIEAQLLQHPLIKEAVVLTREDEAGERRVVAYVAPDLSPLRVSKQDGAVEARSDAVSQWQRVHDETYSAAAVGPSFVGWNSSYNGQPILEVEMQDWLACTVQRIKSLGPRRVLEIGCGVGLLLQHLAPQCPVYVGTDFAPAALERLQRWMSGQENLRHVELLQRSATELGDFADGSFDTVVLNSVIQYFPDVDYLVRVLEQAIRLLDANGNIFIGDVRNLTLLHMFHSAVQLHRAAANVTVGQLKKRIARAIGQEKELVIDPRFFHLLSGRLPGIKGIDLQLKRSRAPNELTRYRYDVVLSKNGTLSDRPICESFKWGTIARSRSGEEIKAAMQERRWPAIRLTSIPNAILAKDAAAQNLIETSEEWLEASALRRQLADADGGEIDPERFWELGQEFGYQVITIPGEPGCFEAQLVDRARECQMPRAEPLPDRSIAFNLCANDPLENSFRHWLVPQFRAHLNERLPEYMIPSFWIVLKELPLTPSGKVDRRALPAPQSRSEESGEYVAPRTEVEIAISQVWADVLQVDQVGVRDNFFQIGGHSLLAMQVLVRIRSMMSIEMPMSVLFELPTVEQMALYVIQTRQHNIPDEMEGAGQEVEELLERLADMSDSEATALLQTYRGR